MSASLPTNAIYLAIWVLVIIVVIAVLLHVIFHFLFIAPLGLDIIMNTSQQQQQFQQLMANL